MVFKSELFLPLGRLQFKMVWFLSQVSHCLVFSGSGLIMSFLLASQEVMSDSRTCRIASPLGQV